MTDHSPLTTDHSPLTTHHSLLSYDQALSFWYGCINYEQRIPKPDDLKLDRMKDLLGRLGNPQQRLRIVHVAGSKGKGSTSAMLAAILRQAGYRTGLFTSPHLCRVEERIQVDDQPITAQELATLLGDVQRACLELPERAKEWESDSAARGVSSRAATLPLSHSPTFFEVATALGFLHFVRRRVDVAVVEVGLGGRFDSTNVCLPEVALITSISFDHTRQLGSRLASIAMEKAGIIKPGRPAISGAVAPEARDVIEQICRQRGAPLRQLGIGFRYFYDPGQVATEACTPHSALRNEHFLRRPRVQIFTDRRAWPLMELGLLGEHQAANAAVAVACIEQLRAAGWHIPDRAVVDGLANVSWPARLEVMGHRPLVVLDCAHNVASVDALVETLQASFPPARRLLIFASSNDKDIAGMFRVLAPHFAHAFLTRYANNPRSVPPEDLAELLRRSAELSCTACEPAATAWEAALAQARTDDLICITGSVFLAGELRPLLVGQ